MKRFALLIIAIAALLVCGSVQGQETLKKSAIEPAQQVQQIRKLSPEARSAIAEIRGVTRRVRGNRLELNANARQIANLQSSLTSPKVRNDPVRVEQYVADVESLVKEDIGYYQGLMADYGELEDALNRVIDVLPIPAADLADLVENLEDNIYGAREDADPDFSQGDCLSHFDAGNCHHGICIDCCEEQHAGDETEQIVARVSCQNQCNHLKAECDLHQCMAGAEEPECSLPDCSDPSMSDMEQALCEHDAEQAAFQCRMQQRQDLFKMAICIAKMQDWLRKHIIRNMST